MADIDNGTLLVCVQAVYECIGRYEGLLKSETLRDAENIEELLLQYDEALKVLKSVYKEQLANGARLPALERVLFEKAE